MSESSEKKYPNRAASHDPDELSEIDKARSRHKAFQISRHTKRTAHGVSAAFQGHENCSVPANNITETKVSSAVLRSLTLRSAGGGDKRVDFPDILSELKAKVHSVKRSHVATASRETKQSHVDPNTRCSSQQVAGTNKSSRKEDATISGAEVCSFSEFVEESTSKAPLPSKIRKAKDNVETSGSELKNLASTIFMKVGGPGKDEKFLPSSGSADKQNHLTILENGQKFETISSLKSQLRGKRTQKKCNANDDQLQSEETMTPRSFLFARKKASSLEYSPLCPDTSCLKIAKLNNILTEAEEKLERLREKSEELEATLTAEVGKLNALFSSLNQVQELRYRSLMEVFNENFHTLGLLESQFEDVLSRNFVAQRKTLRGRLTKILWLLVDALCICAVTLVRIVNFARAYFHRKDIVGGDQIAAKETS